MAIGTANEWFNKVEAALLSAAPEPQLFEAITGFRRRLSAIEAARLADLKRAGASDRNNESTIRSTGTTKQQARKAASRAKAVDTNPTLGEALASGELGEPELDAIAEASEKTAGEGAASKELKDRVKAAGPDKAAAVARAWVEEQQDQQATDDRYERQRRLRAITRFTTRRGTDALLAEGDTETIDFIHDLIAKQADALYQKDGGREVNPQKHPRSYNQRMFDAFAELTTNPSHDTNHNPTGHPPVVHVITHLSDWDDTGPTKATTTDGRQLPTAVLQLLACNATFVGTVFGDKGEILYHGRTKRLATSAQIRALIARDKGCVMCGAHPNRCQAHHLTPFQSPAKGPTDIANMALVCISCHHHIHDNNLTLTPNTGPPDANGQTTIKWRTRPAKPNETTQTRTNQPRAA